MPSATPSQLWTDIDIAKLSSSDIARLNYDEMQALVSSPRCSAIRRSTSQVTESDVLVRLVYALRERCRKELADG